MQSPRESNDLDEVECLIRQSKTHFNEAKEFLLDFMSNHVDVANPEEGIMAIEAAKGQHRCSSELYRTYLAKRQEWFSRFWAEHVAPAMDKKAFLDFLDVCGHSDVGEGFFPALIEYLGALKVEESN